MAETDNDFLFAIAELARPSSTDAIKSEQKRQFLLDLIDHQQKQFERNGNPLCAWLAYLHAREADAAIPAWVLEYLDRCASGMWLLWNQARGGKNIDNTMVAKVIDVAGQRGTGNAFSTFASAKWMFLAETVGDYIRQGDAETYAIEDVAKKNSVSVSTVRRAWKRYQAEYPERVNEILSSTEPPIS